MTQNTMNAVIKKYNLDPPAALLAAILNEVKKRSRRQRFYTRLCVLSLLVISLGGFMTSGFQFLKQLPSTGIFYFIQSASSLAYTNWTTRSYALLAILESAPSYIISELLLCLIGIVIAAFYLFRVKQWQKI